jgi:hypothetical protein
MKTPSEVLENILEMQDNRMTLKDLEFQNANWSYVQTHMPKTPFTW